MFVFRRFGARVAAQGVRAMSAATPKRQGWSWTTRFLVAGTGFAAAYYGFDRALHPRPTTEVVEDLLLQNSSPEERKERLVVLGTGWGAVALLSNIDPYKYEIVCISPRNHFVMTPLLPSVTVGTVEPRTVVESIRAICPHAKFIEAECTELDPKGKTVTFMKSKRTSSSREIKDSTKTRPDFKIAYDKLVVAVGAENNTFNTPGVEEHAHFLKEIIDARRIRAAIIDAFESAVNPAQTEEERKRLLNFIVVGGGPTGVEFAAELADLVKQDLQSSFPQLNGLVNIKLIEAMDHVLSMFDKKISEYTEENFKREHVEVLSNTFVKEVKENAVIVQKKGSKDLINLPCALVVWATGIRARPLINKMREAIGMKEQNNFRALVTDGSLAVKGAPGVYALGDCSTIEQKKLTSHVQDFFVEADTDKNGGISLKEFKEWTDKRVQDYPQLQFLAKTETLEEQFTKKLKKRASGLLKPEEFKSVLTEADRTLRVLPATAQVAAQQGKYLAKQLNSAEVKFQEKSIFASFSPKPSPEEKGQPFKYRHLGSLAYIGGDAAAADLKGSMDGLWDNLGLSVMHGKGTFILWRSFYLSEQFSTRTKLLLAFDWIKANTFGRDVSRY